MFKVVRVREGRQSCSMGWDDMMGVILVDGDVTGCRGVSHVKGEGRNVSHVQGDRSGGGGGRGVSYVRADGRG